MKFSKSGVTRYLKNTGWLLFGRVVQLSVGLIVTVALARIMGPEDFGKLSFVLAIVYLLSVVAQFGMRDIIRKQLLELPEHQNAILGTYFRLSLLFGLCGYVIFSSLILLMDRSGSEALLYLIIGGTILAVNLRIPEVFFEVRVQSFYRILPLVTGVIIAGILKVIFAIQGSGILWIAFAFLLEAILVTAMLWILYGKREGHFSEWTYDKTLAINVCRKSSMLLIAAVSMNLMLRLDQIMIGFIHGDKSVGIYAVAARLSTIWYFIPTVLAASLFPAIMHARRESWSKYQYRLIQYIKLNALLSYSVVLVTVCLAPFLIRYLFGSGYYEAIPILMIHITSAVCVFMHIARLQYLLAEGLHAFILFSSVTGAISNILLNLMLIPQFENIGAAIATVLSLFISSFLLTFLYPKTRSYGKMMFFSLIAPWPLSIRTKPSTCSNQ